MRVLIINCPVRTEAPPNNVPLGIYYVGAAIHRYDPAIQVNYLDLNLLRPVTEDCVRELIADLPEYDIYMISGLITTLRWQKLIVECIRSREPKAAVISGGGLATNLPGHVSPWAIAFAGEADGTGKNSIRDVLYWVQTGGIPFFAAYTGEGPQDLDAAPQINWDEVQGIETYIRNPIVGASAKNSSYAPFHHDRSLSIITSRGCPHGCRFCSHEATGGRNYRMRSAGAVVEKCRELQAKFNLGLIFFVDDNATANRKRLDDIVEGMCSVPCEWGATSRFDAVDDLHLLIRMRESGCRYLAFGGESANRDILKAMGKKNDPEQMARVIGYCREAGIHPNATWIMGWPGETRRQLADTAQFILKHAPENKNLFVATAYPGTELYREVEPQIREAYPDLKDYVLALGDATKPILNYSGMSDAEWKEVLWLVKRKRLEDI